MLREKSIVHNDLHTLSEYLTKQTFEEELYDNRIVGTVLSRADYDNLSDIRSDEHENFPCMIFVETV